MGAAIWSTDPRRMLEFPARQFVRFFRNHGLLDIRNRPQWRVIRGGSRAYVQKLTAPYRDRIRLNEAVIGIRRRPGHVEVRTEAGACERFDHAFIASHSDQALALLGDATGREREILGAIPYQDNEAVLHTDTSLLPRRRRAWAAWNYLRRREDHGRVSLTYNMNLLQHLQAPVTFCVTLNDTRHIDPARILLRLRYQHPVFTPAGVAAQQRRREINGRLRTWYCGAYWRYGFHEDGVVSALEALQDFREHLADEQSPLRRAG
jgi:predicted NAD/FAD-binding protein